MGFEWDVPSGFVKIAMDISENSHRNSEFCHSYMGYVDVYQRVSMIHPVTIQELPEGFRINIMQQ